MIWRIRDRRTFQELRRRGRRVRSGTVAVTMLATPSSIDPPRVAFAVPRSVGPAVVRNRLRRQVRAHLVERRQSSVDQFPDGAWLFAVQPAAAMADRTRFLADVDDCIDRLLSPTGAGR